MGSKDKRCQKMSYFGAMGPALVAKHILAPEQCRPRAFDTNPVECKKEYRKKSRVYKSLQKRLKKKNKEQALRLELEAMKQGRHAETTEQQEEVAKGARVASADVAAPPPPALAAPR